MLSYKNFFWILLIFTINQNIYCPGFIRPHLSQEEVVGLSDLERWIYGQIIRLSYDEVACALSAWEARQSFSAEELKRALFIILRQRAKDFQELQLREGRLRLRAAGLSHIRQCLQEACHSEQLARNQIDDEERRGFQLLEADFLASKVVSPISDQIGMISPLTFMSAMPSMATTTLNDQRTTPDAAANQPSRWRAFRRILGLSPVNSLFQGEEEVGAPTSPEIDVRRGIAFRRESMRVFGPTRSPSLEAGSLDAFSNASAYPVGSSPSAPIASSSSTSNLHSRATAYGPDRRKGVFSSQGQPSWPSSISSSEFLAALANKDAASPTSPMSPKFRSDVAGVPGYVGDFDSLTLPLTRASWVARGNPNGDFVSASPSNELLLWGKRGAANSSVARSEAGNPLFLARRAPSSFSDFDVAE